jgi:hypothetical protein
MKGVSKSRGPLWHGGAIEDWTLILWAGGRRVAAKTPTRRVSNRAMMSNA